MVSQERQLNGKGQTRRCDAICSDAVMSWLGGVEMVKSIGRNKDSHSVYTPAWTWTFSSCACAFLNMQGSEQKYKMNGY